MESEDITIHARSHVIKWINLSEYYHENQRLKNGKRMISLNFKMTGSKKSVRFGLYTKKQLLTPNSGTFNSVLPGKNQPGLYQSDNTGFKITPSSILKERRDSLKDKIRKSNMQPVIPLAEISTRKGLSMEINIKYEDPSHLAMIFENDHHLGKSKIQFLFELVPVLASEDDTEDEDFDETNSSTNTSLSINNNSVSGLDLRTPKTRGNSISKGKLEKNPSSAGIAALSRANSTLTLQSESAHNLRRSLGTLNKRSFYVNDDTVFQGYVPKNRRNPKSKKQFVTRFFILDMKRAALKYYQNNLSKSVKGEVLLKTCVISSDMQSGEIFIDSGFEIWILKPFQLDYKPWLNALDKCLKEETPNEDKETVFEKYVKMKENMLKIQQLVTETKSLNSDKSVTNKLDEMFTLTLLRDQANEAEKTDLYSSFSTEEFYDAIDEIPGIIMIKSEERLDTMPRALLDDAVLEEDEHGDIINTNDPSSHIDTPIQASNSVISKNTDSPDNTHPLPHPPVKRRNDVTESKTKPPSLLSFLRKNVGKDMGSISMPVTSNEPLTILQFLAETMEYSSLLNDALDTFYKKNYDANEFKRKRLALVSSFALSQLAQQRSKIRCLRKPFNPMLGETFEMVNEAENYRFVAEKVEHKPEQVFALFTEGFGMNEENRFKWEMSYTVQPSSKFWGKSIELLNYGTIYLKFIDTDANNAVLETYTWAAPGTILKNLIAGERYIEPTGEIEVKCVESKLKTTFVFKAAGGFFKGRTEQVKGEMHDDAGKFIGSLDGSWTDSLMLMPEHQKIWSAGDLVHNSDVKYGFSKFAANLNEITSLEKDMIPVSDSRFRPDVRVYEDGHIEKAEELKLKLEQDQRTRRNNNEDVKPSYFKKKANLDYHYVRGIDSYWLKRERQDWDSVPKLW